MADQSISPEPPVIVAARYHRISADKAGDEHGVANQQELTAKLLAERGYLPATAHGPGDEPGVFTDNDISAYKGKERPAYEAMLAAAQRGEFNVIVVRHIDRLWANREELARGMKILGKAGVNVVCVKGPDAELGNAQGELIVDLMGAVARYERAIKGERTAMNQREAVAKGWHLGGPRPFGWDMAADPARAGSPNPAYALAKVRPVVNEAEAKAVIQCAEAILAGRTLRSLAMELNKAECFPPARKNSKSRWDISTLRQALLRERNYGVAVFDDERFEGVWPALAYTDEQGNVRVFTEDLWRKLVTKLTAPERRTNAEAGSKVKYLNSGIATCGRCDAPVKAGSAKLADRRLVVYRCPNEHVTRNQEAVDYVVTEWILSRLEHMTPADRAALLGGDEQPSGPDADEAAKLRRQISIVQDGLLDGTFTKSEAKTKLASLRAKLTAAERRMATVTRRPVVAALVAAKDPRKAWQTMPLDRQRAVIRELAVVAIMPSERGKVLTKGGRETWTPEQIRVRIAWNAWAGPTVTWEAGATVPDIVNVRDEAYYQGE
jgi:DNA invertase Pin-like site-specific DNA recombinase